MVNWWQRKDSLPYVGTELQHDKNISGTELKQDKNISYRNYSVSFKLVIILRILSKIREQ